MLMLGITATLCLILTSMNQVNAQTKKAPSKVRVKPKSVAPPPAPRTNTPAPRKTSPIKRKTTKSRDYGSSRSISGVDVGFGGLDLGVNSYLYNNKVDLPTNISLLESDLLRSSNVTLHTIKVKAPLGSNNLKLATSLAIDFKRYAFKNNVALVPDSPTLTFSQAEESYTKNYLKTTYLTVPVILQYRTPSKITIGGGVYGSYLVGSKLKRKSGLFGKEVLKGDFNLNTVQYGATARVGYGVLNAYVNYGLNGLFETGNGAASDLTPISAGLSLVSPF